MAGLPGLESGPGVNQLPARLAHDLAGILLPLDGSQQLFLEAIALGQQISQAIFQLTAGLARFDDRRLVNLELAIRASQSLIHFGAAILETREAILGARDGGQNLDERLVGGLAFPFERAMGLGRHRCRRFGDLDRALLSRQGIVHRLQLGAGLLGLALRDQPLLRELLELLAASLIALLQPFALTAAELDLALQTLDVAPQRVEALGPPRDGLLCLCQ